MSAEPNIVVSMMTPKEIVHELDQHIIGQQEAKRAVAIALRNRWRRMQLPEALRAEVTPKNILMIGPTGVGKTEIARRLARLAKSPFIKVEATKFTEVGYVGRDVDSIIRDLADIAIKQAREVAMKKVRNLAEELAVERVLDAMLSPARRQTHDDSVVAEQASESRTQLRKQILSGELDDKVIEIELSGPRVGVEIMAPPGMEEMTSQLQNMFQSMSHDRKQKKTTTVKEALAQSREEEAASMVNEDDIKTQAITSVEQNGIVFIDELDKVAKRHDIGGGDVSREGVQRDLLPLVEGCTVSTKLGPIRTDHILFIASGAFHHAKPSDLVAELQGRLPIRVELTALAIEDFIAILTKPTASLTEQYTGLLATESTQLEFTESGIQRIAEIAWQVNEKMENIGARRLHTVMERLLEDISFTATENPNQAVVIDDQYVNQQLKTLAQDEDLARYIL